MTESVHLLFGAAVGSMSSCYAAAFTLGVLTHPILDLIPHTEPSCFTDKFKWIGLTALIDFVLGIFVLIVLIYGHEPNYIIKAILGAFGGFLIDLIDLVIGDVLWNSFKRQTMMGRSLSRFHNFVHNQTRKGFWVLGLIPQIIVTIIAIFILR